MAPSRRSRARAAASDGLEPSSDPIESQASDLPSLKFNKQISWQAGKPIAEGELVKRLQALFDELKAIGDSDTFNVESLRPKLSDLAAERLVRHRNRGVQALTVCCFAETLRIFAPNAPYTAKELKELFTLIVEHIIPALADASSPYHSEHLHALRCLEEVESIILISDVPSSTNLLRALFTAAFDVLSGPAKASGKEVTKMTSNVLTELLTVLVGGANNLPDEVIDIVLAQFLRADPRSLAVSSKGKKGNVAVDERQATLAFREAPAAYTMAQEICVSNDTRMARYVLRYFSAILLDTTIMTEAISKKPQRRKIDSTVDDDSLNGPSEEELKELKKAHLLLRELWRAAPSVLQEIVPQLEAELSTENTHIRLMAVETIGDMVAGIGAAGPPLPSALDPAQYPSQSLAQHAEPKAHHFLLTPQSTVSFITKYNSTYLAFLSRQNDKSPVIRAALSTGVGRIISTFAGHAGLDAEQEKELLKLLASTLVDSDERVRHAAIAAIEQCPFDIVVQQLGQSGGVSDENSILANLADRIKDKKLSVRNDATRLLANLWGVASGAILEGNDLVTKLLGDIPSKLFHAYYVNDPDIHKSIDRALFESLIPLSFPSHKQLESAQSKGGSTEADADRIRAERILLMLNSLDEKAKTVFMNKQQRQPQSAKLMLAFINHCEHFNGGVIQAPQGMTDANVQAALHKLIDILAMHLPERQRVADDLKKFAKMHDRRSYNLIRWACAADSDWSKIRKSVREMTKRIEEATSSASSSSSLLDALLTLLYRSSVLIYNKAHVPAIIHYSRTDEHGFSATAHEMMKEISRTQGEVFSAHVQELCKSLVSDAPSERSQHKPTAVDDLKACSEFAKKFADQLPQDRKFFVALLDYARYGQPLAAKYATRILLTTSDKREMYTKEVFTASVKNFEYGSSRCLARLAALSQVVFYGFNSLERDDLDNVHHIVIQQVLMNSKANKQISNGATDGDWTDEPDENIQAKIWALKILVNTLRAVPDESDTSTHADPTFRLLTALISKKGQIKSSDPAPPSHTSRLRLSAVQSILKLARERRYNERVDPALFNAVALTTQDSVAQVRTAFVKKITKYLGQRKLANRYYAPLFLLAHEPITSLRRNTEIWLQSRAQAFARDHQMVLELIIARLISLLAYHPDFETGDTDTLVEMAQYFVFFLKAVANSENISVIFYLAQRVKVHADGISPKSTSIYVLSDLAQAIVRRWDEQKDWNMHTWSDKINLPGGIFAPLKPGEGQAIANKMYLPADVLDALDPIVKSAARTKRPKGARIENGTSRTKKRSRNSRDQKDTPSKRRKSDGARKRKAERWDASEGNVPSSERRRSGRSRATTNYHEESESAEDDDNHKISATNGRARQKPVEISSDVSEVSDMEE